MTKEQAKSKRYDLSANRYRLIDHDATFRERPEITIARLQELDEITTTSLAALETLLYGAIPTR